LEHRRHERSEALTIGGTHLRLLRRVGHVDPRSLDDYRAHGGYLALRHAFEIGADRVIAEIVASKLLGRGGAAFPAGRKIEAVSRASARPHYIVCNADESEPGTFKDRVLMENDPFAVLEAMTIAAFAAGCDRGYIYIRGEYPNATERMTNAIALARAHGFLGNDVMGKGFAFDVELRRGAGAYICGEETALFNSIEGKRGEPRNKPPFPAEFGLFGKPTLVNNVETLACIPEIVLHGGDAFAAIGTAGSTGTKLFCVSGTVPRPGLYEVPFGATLGELIDLAGGIRSDRTLRAVLLGGAAGTFVGPDALSMPLTFEATRAAGAFLGSGVVMVFDDTVDLIRIVKRVAEFFRDESCGQCVPCRVGTVRQLEAIDRMDVTLLNDIARAMRDASICGLGQTAANAVESALTLRILDNAEATT
jgi:NADH-quinone oxidoreductase subunit F